MQRDLTGAELWGTYRIGRRLGAGSFGTVYEAVNQRLGRRFAIKVLSADATASPEIVERFRREAKIASDLGHPNIVDVFDFNKTDDGLHCTVMEFLEGEDLAARIRRTPRPDLATVAGIVRQTCSALQAAHDRGIVHRDLKPANIFLCARGDERDFVKVLDFGISKVLSASTCLTQEAAVVGTPSYMAPEQAEGALAEISPRTDVFALGAVIYELLAGRPAFTGDSLPSVLYKVVHTEPVALASVRPDLPHSLVDVVGRSLAKGPAARFASMRELSQAFGAALPGAAAGIVGPPPAASGDAFAPTVAPDAPAAPPPSAARSTLSGTAAEVAPARAPALTSRGGLWLVGALGALAALVGILMHYGGQPASGPGQGGDRRAHGQSRPREDADALRIGGGATRARRDTGPPTVVRSSQRPDGAASADASGVAAPAAGGQLAESVEIRVTGEPAGARVIDPASGRVLGKVPGVFRFQRTARIRRLRVQHPGHQPEELEIGDGPAQRFRVHLRRAPAGRTESLDPERLPNPFRP